MWIPCPEIFLLRKYSKAQRRADADDGDEDRSSETDSTARSRWTAKAAAAHAEQHVNIVRLPGSRPSPPHRPEFPGFLNRRTGVDADNLRVIRRVDNAFQAIYKAYPTAPNSYVTLDEMSPLHGLNVESEEEPSRPREPKGEPSKNVTLQHADLGRIVAGELAHQTEETSFISPPLDVLPAAAEPQRLRSVDGRLLLPFSLRRGDPPPAK